MKPSSRIACVTEILDALYDIWQEGRSTPVDRLLARYFKERRYIGSKDRGFVSEMTYGILRHGRALEWHIQQQTMQPDSRKLVLAALIFFYEQNTTGLHDLFSGEQYAPAPLSPDEKQLISALQDARFDNDTMPEYAKYNVAEWMMAPLQERFGKEIAQEMAALNQEAPVDLRMNSLKCPHRDDLIKALRDTGHEASPTEHSPVGVRLQKRIAAFATDAFKQGWFEMQDEGSQMVSQLVEAQPGEKVIDFCAGAGGKTLAIAAQMQNKGRILALDVHENRLKDIKKRLKRAGVDNVQVKHIASETDKFLKRHHDSANWVLVDAPCSGSGTWRRNPDLKWRMTPQDITELTDLQQRILAASAKLVKPGGHLVYVTCSVFLDENQKQVTQFLMDYPEFTLVSPAKLWDSLAQPLESDVKESIMQLSPYKHDTDGFFAATFRRNT